MASSIPATSLKVVLLRSLASIRALLLPKLNAPLPAILIWRMKKNQNRTPISKNGAKLISKLSSIVFCWIAENLCGRPQLAPDGRREQDLGNRERHFI